MIRRFALRELSTDSLIRKPPNPERRRLPVNPATRIAVALDKDDVPTGILAEIAANQHHNID